MKNTVLIVMIAFMAITPTLAQNWETNFEQAKVMAANENKTVVLVFQGSDWCAPCIKLDREIWSTKTFNAYAKKHFVMVQADFPRKRKNALSEKQATANIELAERYNKRGIFPFVVVLDEVGKVLGETSYKKVSPEEYIKILTAFQ